MDLSEVLLFRSEIFLPVLHVKTRKIKEIWPSLEYTVPVFQEVKYNNEESFIS